MQSPHDNVTKALGEQAQARFLSAVERLPLGYSEGFFAGRRWGVTVKMTEDRRRYRLWGEELGATDRVSFNLYLLAAGPALRPCEMPAEKVIAFVEGYEPLTTSPGRAC